MGRSGETHYVVVTRATRMPMSRHLSIQDAADYIIYRRAYSTLTVLAQDGAAGAPMRSLTTPERRDLERKLYPTLFE